jgi:Skp family chaperone for outer membrane proteins
MRDGKTWILAALLAGLALAAPARGELRIGFVNSEVIMRDYKAVESVIETFNRDVEGWNQEAQRRKTELESLQRELESQGLMLSDERRQEKEMEHQRRLNEYDQFVQSVFGPDGLAEQRNEELMRPIITKVQALLTKIATEEDYDFILDAADNNVLYADPDHDLTQRVLSELNAEEGSN